MEAAPPTKPPRGVKNPKETSGLLMTVIRTLSTSDSNEQRDQERTKLEKDFKKSNQQLEQLVSIHHDDLTRVMNLFGRLSSLISNSRQQVHAAKDNLVGCKKLLTCRREELKKLWLESVEYKYTLQLLNEIDHIKEVPSQLVNCLSQKDYLQATRLLMSAVNTSENTLKDVVGLQELKVELMSKKQELYTKILEEIKEQIYIKSTHEIIVLKRQGSSRDSTDQRSPLVINRVERKITPRQKLPRPRKLLEVPGTNLKDKVQKSDSIEYADDPEYIIGNLIDCIVLLDKVQEFLEEIKQSTHRDLATLAIRTTKELSSNDSPNILLEFFQVLTEQFRKVLDTHKFLLEYFKKKYNTNSVYDLLEVWLKIQLVMQQLLTDYLDVQNIKKTEQQSTENPNPVNGEQYDINSFFTKKKSQRTIKAPLFKFDNATQNNGISKTHSKAYDKEVGKERLCKPSPKYITQLYVPLSRFSEEMERVVNESNSDQQSKLNIFLNDYIGKVFLGKRHEEIIANAAGEKDAFALSQSRELTSILNSQDPSSPLLTVSVELPKNDLKKHIQSAAKFNENYTDLKI